MIHRTLLLSVLFILLAGGAADGSAARLQTQRPVLFAAVLRRFAVPDAARVPARLRESEEL